ncbi:hypothetical protein C3B51_16140 [Pseudoalteromonas rubra]|uniref:Dienelactone hydrolase domain-containing protein n=1 Tax=Pseudoalteromonas rubra TaxID=43658 RepID=A0A4Q7E5G0_9GAMM|nr:hypothetical protein [Pseudoalteromonas rubra]RZM77578.1 hypothetical protein C3B51_16140 [Pseudoalteromonas rubra]
MVTLIVSDIFGHSDYLEDFAQSLHSECKVSSPYGEFQSKTHLPEAEVYQAFVDEVGHDAYMRKVLDDILAYQPELIIAFSAGAVAAWRALSAIALKSSVKLIAFYPGQIRNFLHLNPGCRVDVFFPYQESHFDIVPVMEILQQQPNVECFRTRYEHGFMNRLSEHYDSDAHEHYLARCQGEVEQLAKIKFNYRRIKDELNLVSS